MMLLVIAALRIKSSAEDVAIGRKANPRIRKLALRNCSLKILATLMKLSSRTWKEVSRFKKLSSLLLPLMKWRIKLRQHKWQLSNFSRVAMPLTLPTFFWQSMKQICASEKLKDWNRRHLKLKQVHRCWTIRKQNNRLQLLCQDSLPHQLQTTLFTIISLHRLFLVKLMLT